MYVGHLHCTYSDGTVERVLAPVCICESGSAIKIVNTSSTPKSSLCSFRPSSLWSTGNLWSAFYPLLRILYKKHVPYRLFCVWLLSRSIDIVRFVPVGLCINNSSPASPSFYCSTVDKYKSYVFKVYSLMMWGVVRDRNRQEKTGSFICHVLEREGLPLEEISQEQ